MARILGWYEYDDDDLTPGKKRGGGLHQNLFDGQGNLRGSARFIPDEERPATVVEPDPIVVYVDQTPTARTKAQEELEMLVQAVVGELVSIAFDRASSHMRQAWNKSVVPQIQAKRDQLFELRARRQQRRSADASEPVEAVEPTEAFEVAARDFKKSMSSSEAQARLLAALAAKAFSDEQNRIVAAADIHDDSGFQELQSKLSELPPGQAAKMLERLRADPSLLSGDILSALGLILGMGSAEGKLLQIDDRSGPGSDGETL